MKSQELKSAKRFGTRYGRAVKLKVANIETLQKQSYKCPSCNKNKAKKTALGIFVCKACGTKFSDKAYMVSK